MQKRLIVINSIVSVLMFAFIFYSYAGVSGGDIAIACMNVFFGLFQLLVISVYLRIKKIDFITKVKVQLVIVALQAIEFFVFIVWGYQMNEYIKAIN